MPRHPQRFAAVADLLAARGIPFVRRSDNAAVPADVRVVLGDSIGELLAYYVAADVAFVGGSLLPLGGQNLIEPIARRRADPHRTAHVQLRRSHAQRAIEAGAARRVADAQRLACGSRARFSPTRDARDACATRALAFCAAHRGAADRLWAWLAPRLDAAVAAHARIRASDVAASALQLAIDLLEILLAQRPRPPLLSRSTPIR